MLALPKTSGYDDLIGISTGRKWVFKKVTPKSKWEGSTKR